MRQPLSLPDNFNPETNMLSVVVDGKTYHGIVPAARLACALVENGTPQDLAQAEKTLRAVMDCQELHEDDPHFGNFRWEREDAVVEDLNAVQFVLYNFIPMMLRYRERLSAALQTQLRASIALGLNEIARIDVHPDYTNIVIKDITNSCLGGELLGDASMAGRGYMKMARWMQLTDQNGIPVEFNSPGYARIAIEVLHTLASLTSHRATQMRASLMRNRLALSSVLHIHRRIGRLAGPYSRAYLPDVFAQTPAEMHEVKTWITAGIVPHWLADVLAHDHDHIQINETANAEIGAGITTYQSRSFALGVATQELTAQSNRFIALQSNVCIAQYILPGEDRPGVFITRYLHDDHWIGDFYSTPSRSSDFLLPEEGRFFGVQDGTRMIGVYAPRDLNGWNRCRSAKAALIWLQRDSIYEIWIDDQRIEILPAQILPGQTIVIGSGEIYTAIRPLTVTDLGRNAPLQLTTIDRHLALEMYNYQGPAKTFWELAVPGSFYQGQPQCGFYVEFAERADYADGNTFSKVVASGSIIDEAQPPVTHDAGLERLWEIEYARDGKKIGLEVDLMTWKLKRRWTQDGELGWPMLESPLARQTRNGSITVDDSTLNCGAESAWLLALPESRTWVAAYHGQQPAPLTLTLPDGKVEIAQMGMGTVIWKNGVVTIDALHLMGDPKITGGQLA